MQTWPFVAVALVTAIVLMVAQARSRALPPPESGLMRAFIAWSSDGKHVLLVEAAVVSPPVGTEPARMAPRRWLIVDASAAKPTLAWSARSSENPEKIRVATVARGFEAAMIDGSYQPTAPIESAADQDANFDGQGLRGRLEGRRSWAHVAPRAFVSPDGGRAFVMPDERVITLEPFVTLKLPAGWRRVPNTVLTYENPERTGGLQLSLLMNGTTSLGITLGQSPSGALKQLAEMKGWTVVHELGAGKYALGTWAAALCEDRAAGMHIVAHFLTRGSDLIFATFISGSPVSLEQARAVGDIVRSADSPKSEHMTSMSVSTKMGRP